MISKTISGCTDLLCLDGERMLEFGLQTSPGCGTFFFLSSLSKIHFIPRCKDNLLAVVANNIYCMFQGPFLICQGNCG